MTRISVRGFAVASATAVTTVGAVVGVASGSEQSQTSDNNDVEASAADATLLSDIPAGQQAQAQTASVTHQADTQSHAAQVQAKKDAQEAARKKAAKEAAAKREAARKAAAKKAAEKKAEQSKPSADAGDFPVKASYSTAEVKQMARKIVGGGQFQCFSNIVDRESGWNYRASNPSSGAYGLVQALPGNKMSSVASDWKTNPATQIKWGLNYMNDRYDSPCGAWDFWQANGHY